MINLESKMCGMIKLDKTIYAACMDRVIHAYNFRGIKVYNLRLNADILCIEGMEFGKNRQVKVIK